MRTLHSTVSGAGRGIHLLRAVHFRKGRISRWCNHSRRFTFITRKSEQSLTPLYNERSKLYRKFPILLTVPPTRPRLLSSLFLSLNNLFSRIYTISSPLLHQSPLFVSHDTPRVCPIVCATICIVLRTRCSVPVLHRVKKQTARVTLVWQSILWSIVGFLSQPLFLSWESELLTSERVQHTPLPFLSYRSYLLILILFVFWSLFLTIGLTNWVSVKKERKRGWAKSM